MMDEREFFEVHAIGYVNQGCLSFEIGHFTKKRILDEAVPHRDKDVDGVPVYLSNPRLISLIAMKSDNILADLRLFGADHGEVCTPLEPLNVAPLHEFIEFFLRLTFKNAHVKPLL